MNLTTILLYINRFALPLLGLVIVAMCVFWLMRLRAQVPSEAYLINAINHDKLHLSRFENSVGRSKHCDIVLNYPSVSRFHAVIAKRRDGWVIIDTGSHGGTKVNHLPLEKRRLLEHGQTITFGTFEFKFFDTEEEAKGAIY